MKNKETIELIEKLFASEIHTQICQSIINFFESSDTCEKLTVNQICDICKIEKPTKPVLDVLTVLSGHKLNFLSIHFIRFNDDGTETELDNVSMSLILNNQNSKHEKEKIVIKYGLQNMQK